MFNNMNSRQALMMMCAMTDTPYTEDLQRDFESGKERFNTFVESKKQQMLDAGIPEGVIAVALDQAAGLSGAFRGCTTDKNADFAETIRNSGEPGFYETVLDLFIDQYKQYHSVEKLFSAPLADTDR